MTELPQPGSRDAHEHQAQQLADQARSCEAMGSPLYAALLRAAATDCRQGGIVADVLHDEVLPERGDALALRFMAAVHRLVLQRRAPLLATFYPSVGGTGVVDGAWPAFRRVLATQTAAVQQGLRHGCQTNEVGRTTGLVGGFLRAARRGLPVRMLEIGASAGLNLRWPWFRYEQAGTGRGPLDSPVQFVDPFAGGAAPDLTVPLKVAELVGCDPAPIDPTSASGRLALSASVWADQTERFNRLAGALELAAEHPAPVEEASADVWLERRLDRHLHGDPHRGETTVVFHSVVWEYFDAAVARRVLSLLATAGSQARPDAPLVWLRSEPDTALRGMAVRSTVWDGGAPAHRLLAIAGAHGPPVQWRDEPDPEPVDFTVPGSTAPRYWT